jgi:hypothetical protein
MQIHELTRKPLREASVGGALSGAAAVAGGIGTQLVNKLAKSQGINPVVGGQNQATGAGAQSAAAAANDPLIKGLATSAAKEFKQDVYELMKTMRTSAGTQATRASELPAAKLRKVLEDMTTRLIGASYQTLAQKVDPKSYDGQGAAYGAELTDTIDDQIDAIIAQEQTDKPDPAKESALWNTLAQAISGAKSSLDFGKTVGGTQSRPGSVPSTAARLADQLGLNNQQIAAIQTQVKQSGGAMTPDLKALFGVTK